MVYSTLNYWTFSIARCSWEYKQDVSETGCFRPQVKGGEDTYSAGPLRKS
jgi:hypothetical protein